MNKKETVIAVVYALAAAALYAINVPCSKMLLTEVPPIFMAGLLHAHIITHTHKHNHISNDDIHDHHHRVEELEKYAVYEEIRK